MMFDLFAEHRHFGVVEFSAWLAIHQLGNQHLATIMFDMRFVEDVVLDLAAKCRIENLLLNHRVNDEFGADLLAKLSLRSLPFAFSNCSNRSSTSRWSCFNRAMASGFLEIGRAHV